jgi:hypothetical protein
MFRKILIWITPIITLVLLLFISTVNLTATSLDLNPRIETTEVNLVNPHQEKLTLQSVGSSDTAYSLIIRNRTPIVKPGQTIEIEIFFSGYGIPEKNKLVVQCSSPYIINKTDPGTYTISIGSDIDPSTGKIIGGGGNANLVTAKMSDIGITVPLGKGFFAENTQQKNIPDYGLEGIVSESVWDYNPPILFKINTAKNAPSGDYDISFVFTYGNEQNISQDYKTAQFHVSSWWERNQGWIGIVGAIIALLSLLTTAIFELINYFKPS